MLTIDQRIARETRERRLRLGMIPGGPSICIRQPSVQTVLDPLPDFPRHRWPMPPPSIFMQICHAVADAFELQRDELIKSKRRLERLSVPRFAAMLLCQELLPPSQRSLTRIGQRFRRDHTSILHGIRRAKELAETDQDFAARLSNARMQLSQGGNYAVG